MPGFKFRVADIVHPDSRELAQQFDCAVCLHIVDDPLQTPCGHIFCHGCVNSLAVCPTCRDPLENSPGVKKLAECNKPMSRLMLGIKVHCPYNTLAVPSSTEEPLAKRQKYEDGSAVDAAICDWAGSLGDLLGKHLAECRCHRMPCPHSCGDTIRRGDLVEHELTCQKKFEHCSICGDSVRPGTMAEHRDAKAGLHVQLLEQKLEEKEAEAAAQVTMEERLFEKLKPALANLAKTSHVTNVVRQRAEEVQRDIQGLSSKKVRWKISNVAGILREHPKNSFIKSDYFNLAGFPGFQFEFYPNGKECTTSKSLAGKSALFLHAPLLSGRELSMTVVVSVNGAKTEISKDFGRGQLWGTCNIADSPKATDDFVTIRGEVIDSEILLCS